MPEKPTQTSDAGPQAVGSLDAWPSPALVSACSALLLGLAGWRLRGRDA